MIKFTKEHEWILVDGQQGKVGITEYAQQQLGDVVFVDLPAVGKNLVAGKEAAVVESVKAASEVYAPVDGVVLTVNSELGNQPAFINEDARGKGWFFTMNISNLSQLDGLLDEAAYDNYLKGLA
ncbi:MAG: glycine cleavage system protein GcvH [Alphaproteobacteria bacterium]